MSSGISLPEVDNLSLRFEGAMSFLVKGGVSISDQSLKCPNIPGLSGPMISEVELVPPPSPYFAWLPLGLV